MKAKLVSVILVLVLVVVAAAACAKAAPTPTPVPTARPTVGPTPTVAPTVGPTAQPTPTTAPAKVYKLRYATTVAIKNRPWQVYFVNEVEKRSGGRIKVEVYTSGEHKFAASDYLPGVRDRVFDMGLQDLGYMIMNETISGVLTLPLLLGGSAPPEEVYAMFDEFRNVFLDPVLEKYNQILLSADRYAPLVGMGTKPFTSWENIKGLKLRAYSELTSKVNEALGAASVTMPLAEFYPNAQKGLVDGLFMTMTYGRSLKLFEVVKYVTYSAWLEDMEMSTINKDAFNELPEDLRALVLQVGKETQDVARKNEITREQEDTIASLLEFRITITTPSAAFEKEVMGKMRPIWDDWAAKAGPQGKDLLDRVQKFHEDWLKTH